MRNLWMTPHAAVLVDPSPGWATTLAGSMSSGGHALVVTSEVASIEGRLAGFELRDTLLILSSGPRPRYAFLFRKPTDGAILDQVIESSAGALNIDACRLSGRWPPNVLFIHTPECRHGCAANCPVGLLDQQAGERPSTLTGRADPTWGQPRDIDLRGRGLEGLRRLGRRIALLPPIHERGRDDRLDAAVARRTEVAMTQAFSCGGRCPKGGEHSWDGPGVVWTMPCPACADVTDGDCKRCKNTREVPSGGAATCSKCGLDAMTHSMMHAP